MQFRCTLAADGQGWPSGFVLKCCFAIPKSVFSVVILVFSIIFGMNNSPKGFGTQVSGHENVCTDLHCARQCARTHGFFRWSGVKKASYPGVGRSRALKLGPAGKRSHWAMKRNNQICWKKPGIFGWSHRHCSIIREITSRLLAHHRSWSKNLQLKSYGCRLAEDNLRSNTKASSLQAGVMDSAACSVQHKRQRRLFSTLMARRKQNYDWMVRLQEMRQTQILWHPVFLYFCWIPGLFQVAGQQKKRLPESIWAPFSWLPMFGFFLCSPGTNLPKNYELSCHGFCNLRWFQPQKYKNNPTNQRRYRNYAEKNWFGSSNANIVQEL